LLLFCGSRDALSGTAVTDSPAGTASLAALADPPAPLASSAAEATITPIRIPSRIARLLVWINVCTSHPFRTLHVLVAAQQTDQFAETCVT
jgi:hypothetical protein